MCFMYIYKTLIMIFVLLYSVTVYAQCQSGEAMHPEEVYRTTYSEEVIPAHCGSYYTGPSAHDALSFFGLGSLIIIAQLFLCVLFVYFLIALFGPIATLVLVTIGLMKK